jgi:hypothetical protein
VYEQRIVVADLAGKQYTFRRIRIKLKKGIILALRKKSEFSATKGWRQ